MGNALKGAEMCGNPPINDLTSADELNPQISYINSGPPVGRYIVQTCSFREVCMYPLNTTFATESSTIVQTPDWDQSCSRCVRRRLLHYP